MKEVFAGLNRCPLFAGIAEEDLDALLVCLGAQSRSYPKGENILSEGDPARFLGVILEGGAQVVREDYDGSRSMLAQLVPGDLFAEAFACAGAPAMPVSVVAAENSRALLIEAHRLTHPCAQACGFHNQLILNMMKILATKNLLCMQKIEVTSKRTTRDKLMAYLRLQAKRAQSSSFEIPFDRQALADYLEVDRSGLSSEIGKLRREGVLTCERSRFTLL